MSLRKFIVETPPSANTQKKRTEFWLDMQELFRRIHNEVILNYPAPNRTAFQTWFNQYWYDPICAQANNEYQSYIAGKPDTFIETFNTITYPAWRSFPDAKYGTLKTDIILALSTGEAEVIP